MGLMIIKKLSNGLIIIIIKLSNGLILIGLHFSNRPKNNNKVK